MGTHAHFDAWDENDKLVPDRLIVYKWFSDEHARQNHHSFYGS